MPVKYFGVVHLAMRIKSLDKTIGRIKEFCDEKEDWDQYAENLIIFCHRWNYRSEEEEKEDNSDVLVYDSFSSTPQHPVVLL